MRIHYLQHVPFEGLGSMERALRQRGHTITAAPLYAGGPLPSQAQFDWLIVMGGPMGVHDESEHAWLVDEQRFIQNSIDHGKLVLGICLGAQLIAHALGARVYPGAHKEIGWYPIERVEGAESTSLGSALPETIEAFHWHGDTYDLPSGAVHLARSKVCENQAFVYEDRVLALQFHLETTPAAATALIDNCADELVDGPYIQAASSMLQKTSRFERINEAMWTILDRFATLEA